MRVLIADDDAVSRRLLHSTLVRWNYEVVACIDGTEAWEALQKEGAPQLAILDWMMPGMDGVQLCREVRKRINQPYTYILLLTAKTEKGDIVAGMEAGADDYITKPFDAQELKVRVRAGQRILDLQNELIHTQEALLVQATHDPLTGLYNRGAILKILEHELDRTRRQASSVGVMLIDLDHFKNINDTLGHQAGDLALVQAAQLMLESTRSYDSIGRYGGEEFLVVAPGVAAPSIESFAERLRLNLANHPMTLGGTSVKVTCSLGVAVSDQLEEPLLDNLIRAADAALYRAKAAGRDRVELSERVLP
ncbi:MAG TPA: diguanylate cyclase [Terriglobia bacterium]|nr:diguanylate cyclase [Terriglobia bacterium]